jgi:hypothetical protein
MNTNAAMDTAPRDDALQLDVVLPQQYWQPRFHAGLLPEKRLMLAVLEEAVFTFQRCAAATSHAGRDEMDDVAGWFDDDDTAWPFSFVNICDALGFEPDFVRGGLSTWQKEHLAMPPERRTRVRNPFRRMSGSRTRPSGKARPLQVVG